jgi:hypothetical protein
MLRALNQTAGEGGSMGRAIRILLGICVGAALLLTAVIVAAGVVVARGVETERGEIATLAREIADFSAPTGYGEEFGLSIAGWTLVTYQTTSGDGHLLLAHGPGDLVIDRDSLNDLLSEGNIERGTVRDFAIDQAKSSLDSDYDRLDRLDRKQLRTAGTKDVVIAGLPTSLRVREGLNSHHQPYREITGVFQGRSGPTFPALTAPIAEWDEAALDVFIASIR